MSVSIISACKNRSKSLRISLSSWLLFEEVGEIIIVDWDSDPAESIDDITLLDERIKVIKVQNETYFNQPQPLNLAASISTGDWILKLDCDHILNPYYNFFKIHDIDQNYFVTGFNQSLGDPCLGPIWGLLYVHKSNFMQVGGYNENMGKYYAVEDDELSLRLKSLGIKSKIIDIFKYSVIHIPHSDKKRVENFESFSRIEDLITKKYNNSLSSDIYSQVAFISKEKNLNNYDILKYLNKLKCFYDDTIIVDIDYYSKPLYNWKIEKINDQIYSANKM